MSESTTASEETSELRAFGNALRPAILYMSPQGFTYQLDRVLPNALPEWDRAIVLGMLELIVANLKDAR